MTRWLALAFFLVSFPALAGDRFVEFSSLEEAEAFAKKMSILKGYMDASGNRTEKSYATKTLRYTEPIKHPSRKAWICTVLESDVHLVEKTLRKQLKEEKDVKEFVPSQE